MRSHIRRRAINFNIKSNFVTFSLLNRFRYPIKICDFSNGQIDSKILFRNHHNIDTFRCIHDILQIQLQINGLRLHENIFQIILLHFRQVSISILLLFHIENLQLLHSRSLLHKIRPLFNHVLIQKLYVLG